MSSTENERRLNKRPRPVVSCLECRNRKLKCDRTLPCAKCVKDGRENLCRYADGQIPTSNHNLDGHTAKRRRLSTEPRPDTASSELLAKFNELQSRVQQLEGTLTRQSSHDISLLQPSSSGQLDHAVSQTNQEPYFDEAYVRRHDQLLGKDTLTQVSNFTHLRLSVQHLQFPDARKFVEHLDKDVYPEEMADVAYSLRVLHDRLSTRPPRRRYNVYDNIIDVLAHMERMLPSPHACHLLIGHYFDYFEDVLRILHRGTARSRFRSYFNDPSSVNRQHCIPQLLAVVSIASSLGIFPECECPALHGQDDGIGAYQLLRNYLDLLTTIQWSELDSIQIAALTLKFHKSCSLNGLEAWAWSGQVSRRAMAAGMHLQYESWGDNVFDAELRKRLWQTILEFELTISIACQMPYGSPLWRGTSPMNIDDAQLFSGMTILPANKELEEWTNGLCQHVLARSFNDRVAAYNEVSSVTISPYGTILKHTRHLEQIIHDLPTCFRMAPSVDEAADTPYRLMAKMTFDFLLRRPLKACYAPYAKEMPSDDRFRDARIPWIQGCTIGVCFQDLFDPLYPTIDLPEPRGLWDYFYNVYGWDLEQFMLATCLELQRLQALDVEQPDIPSTFTGHALRAPVKVMGWSRESMIKSLEDTIGPMSRRVGRHGAMLQDVVKWVTIIGSLRIGPTCSRWISIKNELQVLVSGLRRRFLINTTDQSTDDRHATERMADLLWLQQYLQHANEIPGGNNGG